MKRVYSILFSVLLFLVSIFFPEHSVALADSPPPGMEYPIVWWAQNHIQQSLEIFRFTTAETLEAACRSGQLKAPPKIQTAWFAFAKKGKRRQFCRRYPGQTHHLLGEAPYFMVSPPAVHR